MNRLAKTDKIDAAILVEFARSRELPPDMPRDSTLVLIEKLLLRREQLVSMVTMEKGFRENTDGAIRLHIEDHMKMLEAQIKNIDRDIRAAVKSSQLGGHDQRHSYSAQHSHTRHARFGNARSQRAESQHRIKKEGLFHRVRGMTFGGRCPLPALHSAALGYRVLTNRRRNEKV